jgi:aminoglycoside phosphotransferase family enzyme/predicted kinase
MEIDRLIAALSDPAVYPDALGPIEVRQTHVSAVFLTPRFAYKIKKPASFGFLDFSTLDRRLHFCREEVRLNRRLAPRVYLGVVPIASAGVGLRVEGDGDPVEWAVKMVRLPDEASLEHRLKDGKVDPPLIESLARRLAAFHAAAEGGERVAGFGRFDLVAGNARDNFTQSSSLIGVTLSRTVFDRLVARTEEFLDRFRALIADRAARRVPRDGHGDLRLDHVYFFPDQPPPDDIVLLDCIEFNERFRCADPAADLAFLTMDLAFHGRRDLADLLAAAYFPASGDAEGALLLPFYTAYRAAVRGKVEGLELAEREIDATERADALRRARGHWLFALGELEPPSRRPCVVLVGGLPGAGKSTLAAALAADAGFDVVRSDVVRKELTGAADLYSTTWTERTYAECLRRTEVLLFEGRRVLLDATFREDRRRRQFLNAARAWGAPALFLHCQAAVETIQERLRRRRGDASDADWSTYLQLAREWEDASPAVRPFAHVVATDGGREGSLAQARAVLRRAGLVNGGNGQQKK